MIIRALRLTDKLGNAALKTLAWLARVVAVYVTRLVEAGSGVFGLGASGVLRVAAAVGLALLSLLRFLWTGLVFIISTIAAALTWLFRRVSGLFRQAGSGAAAIGEQAAQSTRQAVDAERRRMDTMAQRAEELSETVVLVEDPLKARNRTLSALLVVLMAAVVGLLIWATAPDDNPQPVPVAVGGLNTTPDAQQTPFATPVPTVTPRPEALRVGGSLVYTVRDNGQDDLWVTVIGFDEAVPLTNNPADDRDPAWSPDGHFVAYGSHRDGNWELYVQDVRTGTATRLTYTLGYEGAPTWSPDGQWLVYEAYIEDNLDIYITRVDGTQGPIRLTYDAAPDFQPVWSPGGREIAFVSWRDGNQDIYVLSLDDPTETLARNITNTPELNESYPAWSPDGLTIAYSAFSEGLEVVYAQDAAGSGEPVVIDRGRAPAWSPDGTSLIYAVEQGGRSLLVAGQYQAVGVASQAVSVPGQVSGPDWTAWRPQGLASVGSVSAPDDPLYTEEISFPQESAPYYRLLLLGDVEAPNPVLSDRVNDSFMALRQAVVDATGVDYLGELEDVFWPLDRLPEPGQARLNWHMTGRSFALNRNLIYGFPPGLEVVREDIGVYTYWRVYARAAVQDGQLGEPLRQMPWDFTARSGGDVEAYEQGGRLRAAIPTGYYVDLTQLFADYGWERLPADRSWRYNFGGVLFWQFVKPDGLTWQEAMLEIYTAEELNAYLEEPTPFPTATLAPPTPTPEPSRTPTPVPPDAGAADEDSPE